MTKTPFFISLLIYTLLSFGCGKDAPAPEAKASAEAPAAQPAAAPEATKYGAGVGQEAAVSVDDILADPAAYAGKKVRVEGMITDVCPKRGCWIEMAGERPGNKLRFKVRDGEMVFPMTSKGKYAVTAGVVALSELSLEESKKYAAYQAKEYGKDIDPEAVTEPITIVRIDGTGAEIRDRE